MWLSTWNNVGTEQEILFSVSPTCCRENVSSSVGQKMCFLLFRLISLQMEHDTKRGGTGVISERNTLNRCALLTECFRCAVQIQKFLIFVYFGSCQIKTDKQEFIIKLTNWGCCDSEQRFPGRKHSFSGHHQKNHISRDNWESSRLQRWSFLFKISLDWVYFTETPSLQEATLLQIILIYYSSLRHLKYAWCICMCACVYVHGYLCTYI